MNDQPERQQADPRWGLCARCAYRRTIRSDRGSRFVLCARAASDPRFRRYPPLPVVICAGFEPEAGPAPADGSDQPLK